jgi:hypothetical protein
MPYNTDKIAGKNISPRALVQVIQNGYLKCPHVSCDMPDMTHVVDVAWERDPDEGDRRWVRLEVRCESGHGYLLLIRNHAGESRIVHQLLEGELSPFAEGVRW